MLRRRSLTDDPTLRTRLPFGSGWPAFIFRDAVARRLYPTAERIFAQFSIVLLDDQDAIVAGGWGVPLRWNGEIVDLPGGWDGALERAVAGYEQGGPPDTLCAMATEVVGSARGSGRGSDVLAALREVGAAQGLDRMVAPARPTLKHRYPLTPIDRYARWTDAHGAPFDPWLRAHTRVGATLLHPTNEAMHISAAVAEWEELAGMRFPESGDYIVPDALAPVRIDRDRVQGTYVEPAVWTRHC